MTDKEKIIIDLKQALDGLDITSNLRLVLINTIEYLQKELVSEDFEEAMQHNAPNNIGIDDLLYWRNGFISGAKWKEQKDFIVSNDLEDAAKYCIPDKSYHMTIESKEGGSGENVYDYVQMLDMFKAGAKWKEQKMMAKAIDGKVIANGMGNPILHLWDKGKHLIDKKVKVIVIKED